MVNRTGTGVFLTVYLRLYLILFLGFLAVWLTWMRVRPARIYLTSATFFPTVTIFGQGSFRVVTLNQSNTL
jgi:hypothetical protein